MRYLDSIKSALEDAEKLETLYRGAIQEGRQHEFESDLLACRQQAPESILLAAWFYRLQNGAQELSRSIHWMLVVPLAIANGLIFWAISDNSMMFLDRIPYLGLFWAPITAIFVMGFLSWSSRKNSRRSLLIGVCLVLFSAYVFWIIPTQASMYHNHAADLMALHLPILAWAGTGISILGWRASAEERFAFLIKSLEVFITAGLYLIAGVAFGLITVGLFTALNVTIPESLLRLIAAGGAGLIPTIAVASIYNPLASPAAQDFHQGLSKFIAQMMRLLLPLTLGVLIVYILFIPFNFMEPFKDRDVLIVYNLMLFAIMGLLVGATPIQAEELSPKMQTWLRAALVAVAILAVLVSLYALSATLYRTILGGITINRTAILGWNSINIGILVVLIIRQLRPARETWAQSLYATFSTGAGIYLLWALFLVTAIPLLFR